MLLANERNNSQHCWPSNVQSFCVRRLALVCKWMQQLLYWDLQCILGKIQPIRLWRPCVMRVCGPNNVRIAVQTDPTLLRCASAITGQKLLSQKFDCSQTLRNNSQQHATGCAKRRNNVGKWSCCPTMLRPFARGYRKCDVIYSHSHTISCFRV